MRQGLLPLEKMAFRGSKPRGKPVVVCSGVRIDLEPDLVDGAVERTEASVIKLPLNHW